MKIAAQHFIPLKRQDNSDGISTRKSSSSLSPEELKLKKACQNFEAIFISYMLKTMHQESEKSSLFGEGLGSDIYKEMFDEKLAEQMSESGQMKIGDIMYKQYAPLVRASEAAKGLKKTPTIEDKPTPAVDASNIRRSGSGSVSDEKPDNSVQEIRRSALKDLNGVRISEPDKPVLPQAKDAAKPDISTTAGARLVVPAEKPDKTSEISRPVAQKTQSTSLLSKFEDLIAEAAEKFGIEPALLRAVMQHESGGNPNAVSPDGAKGLMQLVDGTAKMMGVVDPFNPVENIMGGAKYISQLWDKFGGDLKKVIASYNAGPGAVEKFNGVPPYRETQNYVDKVLATYDMEKQS